MSTCKRCGEELHAQANFCGTCGWITTEYNNQLSNQGIHSENAETGQEATLVHAGITYPSQQRATDYATVPLYNEEHPEQTHIQDADYTTQVSRPVFSPDEPTEQETQGNSRTRNTALPEKSEQAAKAEDAIILTQRRISRSLYPIPLFQRHKPKKSTRVRNFETRWITWMIIVVVPMIILTCIFSAGSTIFVPTLSISEGQNVNYGETLHLHGKNFIPGTRVEVTLDDTYPIKTIALPAESSAQNSPATSTNQAQPAGLFPISRNGLFAIAFTVLTTWKPGLHTLRAVEAFHLRSATIAFIINNQTSNTGTQSATPTAPNGTLTAHPQSSAQGLRAVTPNILTLGPVGEGSTHTVSSTVILTMNSNKPLNWTASWDQHKNPWLQITPTSGQLHAPSTQSIAVKAQPMRLKAGSYTTTVNISSPGDQAHYLSFSVTLVVSAGCIDANPVSLNIISSVGQNNPAPQTVTIMNCNLSGPWFAAVSGGSWLNVSPDTGTLSSGGTQTISVSATNQSAHLGPGTYQGKIVFTAGSGQITIPVTLTVQAPPTLSVNQATLHANTDCTFNQASSSWKCTLSLSNNQDAASNLNWSATSSGISGISVTPASGNLTPGQTTPVGIDIPGNDCSTTATITFSGPNNTINVPWSCTPA